jgi:hypothetical protein
MTQLQLSDDPTVTNLDVDQAKIWILDKLYDSKSVYRTSLFLLYTWL